MKISDIPKDLLAIMTGKDETSSMIIVSRNDARIFNRIRDQNFNGMNSGQMFKLMLEQYMFDNQIYFDEVDEDVRASETNGTPGITERPGTETRDNKDTPG